MKPKSDKKRFGGISEKILISAVFILLQFAVLFVTMYKLNEWAFWINTACRVLSIIFVIIIIGKRQNPSYKLMWVAFILTFPIFAVPVYLIWGNSLIAPRFKKRLVSQRRLCAPFLKQDKSVKSRLNYADIFHARQSTYLQKESGFPVYSGTEAEYLSPGEKFFPRFLEELRRAEHFIFLEFYIIAEGKMWSEIYEILKEKAKKGVEVKIIFDDLGSASRQYKTFESALQKNGIKVSVFNPIKPSFDIFLNNRNHRKIAVIDGKVAFTGGINIADEYINHIERFGYWMDCAACFKGDAVRSFTVMFAEMWNAINKRGKIELPGRYIVDIFPKSEGFVQPYCDDPIGKQNPAEGLYMQILNSAQRYVYIASPYLILDNEMITCLCGAARSGIDVRIVTPKKHDKWYVHPVTQYYYSELLEAGVKIYEFTPGFMHSKIFVSDDSVATIGSVNMDYRSFFFNFECGAWMCKLQAVFDIKKHMLRIIEDSEEITLKAWKKRPIKEKLKQFILHLFSPFM